LAERNLNNDMQIHALYRVAQKTAHYTIVHIFAKY